MSNTKRHHFVPKMYLDRFSSDGKIQVRRRDGGSFGSGTQNVAVEAGFYDLAVPGGGVSREVEGWLSQVEGSAATVLRTIDTAMDAPPPGVEEREVLSAYLALQFTRTPEQRERVGVPRAVARFLNGRGLTRELMREFLEVEHLGFPPSDSEVQGAFDMVGYLLPSVEEFTQDKMIELMIAMAERVAPILQAMSWTVEHDRKGRFMTSDTPLTLWRTPAPRDRFEGFGIENCEEIRFPLDPTKQLVLTHKSGRPASVRVSPQRAAESNQDLAYGCHRFIISHPSQVVRTMGLDLPPKRPVQRFNVGPEMRQGPDGRWAESGQEILHMWVPRR
jgi:hypothetical protein